MLRKAVCLAFVVLVLAGCAKKENNQVVIYSTSEDYRIEYFQNMLDEKFPGYDVTIEYYSTGNLAAKLKAEGTQTYCDIVGELEAGYAEGLLDNFASLSAFDSSIFLDALVPAHKKYFPFYLNFGCVVLNKDVLAKRNLPAPRSYQDLLKPEYRGLLSMPNPKSSGTGYFFLKNLVNTMGEEAAFAYFDGFAENVLQFTSSGSGPINALIQGEAGIGLGMTAQAVVQMNQGAPLSITYFEEGSPYTLYVTGIIKGKEERKAVREVFEFYMDAVSREDKRLYVPDQIFKDQVNMIPNYPFGIKIADMRGIENLAEKERLLSKWKY
ncbi:MAG: extracellular solute-binding protein [Spirochaetaceae bacterium]|jgi:iron(III) transport system substrate-binding protein|nr:extracellular solute-binding protein [Spirochaetaceae bacterium]